ncbi:ribonuclease III [Solimonas sp. SE-A11]|nr:ribonuclease III [Solimonas sp. SE-A11]MDM4772346.1 ribonuclease III [Solimonas sp. SE-A11]
MGSPDATLVQRLGYKFRDGALLQQALTHRSYAHGNNERLEFLGDGLLNFVIGERLYALQPKAEEGALSRLRASLVREETLALLGRDLQLGELLRLGESELKSGGYRRDSILADALEAIIGAVFIDGGFDAARGVCERLYAPLLADLPDAESLKDPKTRLQEALQADGRPLPRYEILSESGPPHARRFAVRCLLPDNESFTESEGASRRSAEQRAAELMISKIHA